jgi:hypothetical protein
VRSETAITRSARRAEPVLEGHQAGVALEREVVDGEHRRADGPQRQRVLVVAEAWSDAAQQPRQPPGHPELLRAGRERERLDSLWYALRVAGDRGEAQVGRRGGQGAEEVLDVGLVPGPLPPEHVRVD